MARKRLGELLLERRVITQEQLAAALAMQRQVGGRLGAALVAKGYLSEAQLCRTLGDALGLPVLESVALKDWSAVHLLRASFCERHELFPVALEDTRGGRRQIVVAMADPLDLPAIEQIEFTTGCKVQPALASRGHIHAAIRHFYHRRSPSLVDKGHESGRMTIVRPGGEEVVVDTKIRGQTPKPPPLPRGGEPEEIVPLTEEVTSRTEVSELIRAREQAKRAKGRSKGDKMDDDLAFLTGTEDPQAAQLEDLERRFWALMRIMAKKGLITKEELQEEFDE